jgi:hypothetical protein
LIDGQSTEVPAGWRSDGCPMFSPEDIAKLDQLAQLACAAPDEYSILDVAAVGLVEKVWRNSAGNRGLACCVGRISRIP